MGSLDVFCAEAAKQSKLDRVLHRKENKRKLALYKAKFTAARHAMTVISDLHSFGPTPVLIISYHR